jgi:hypothetical protein
MSTDDPRTAYLDAREAYAKTREMTTAHASLVAGVGRQIEKYPDGFVSATLGGKKDGIHTIYDLTAWPSADDLRRDFLALKTGFDVCKALYEKIPQDKRSGCKPPPTKPGEP